MPMLKSEYETGAYEWINSVNGKRYVGGAYKSFDDRRETHLYALRSGKARNLHFQAAWNKYGEAVARLQQGARMCAHARSACSLDRHICAWDRHV